MIARRGFALAASAYATAGLARFPAGAAEFTYKLGHDDPPALPSSVRIAQAAERIKDESGGRLEIQVFPNDQLGSARDMLGQLRLGAISFARLGYADVAAAVPACGMDWIPYIYTGYRQAFDARDGAWGAYLRGAISKVGLYAFEKTWELGFRQIYNNVRPINSPDDLRGVKIRTVASTIQVEFFKAVGATPTTMGITELYPALQTRLVDGGEGGLGPIFSRKFYEVVKYLSITNHQATGIAMLANAASWQALPRNLRDIVARNLDAAAATDREEVAKGDAQSEADLKSKGMIDNHADIGAFKAALRRAGMYAQWREAYGTEAWSALEKSVGPLA